VALAYAIHLLEAVFILITMIVDRMMIMVITVLMMVRMAR